MDALSFEGAIPVPIRASLLTQRGRILRGERRPVKTYFSLSRDLPAGGIPNLVRSALCTVPPPRARKVVTWQAPRRIAGFPPVWRDLEIASRARRAGAADVRLEASPNRPSAFREDGFRDLSRQAGMIESVARAAARKRSRLSPFSAQGLPRLVQEESLWPAMGKRMRPAAPAPPAYLAFTGATRQISSAYCRIVRSELNFPMRATLRTAIRVHRSASRNAFETCSWQAR